MATTVVSKSWTPVSTGGGYYITNTLGASDGGHSTNTVVSPPISAGAKLAGSQALFFVNVTAATGNTNVADMFLEFSPDGTNFTDHSVTDTAYAPLLTSITGGSATFTGYKIALGDNKTRRFPYCRIGINSAGVDLGSLKLQFGYSFLKP